MQPNRADAPQIPHADAAVTAFTIFRPGAEPQAGAALLPAQPGYVQLDAVLRPLLDGGDPERVNVFWDGRYTDMFVDVVGTLKGLPRNETATAIYRNNWLTHRDPNTPPEDLPAIYGPAVLFSRKVWF